MRVTLVVLLGLAGCAAPAAPAAPSPVTKAPASARSARPSARRPIHIDPIRSGAATEFILFAGSPRAFD